MDFTDLKKFWELIKPKDKKYYIEIRFTDKNKSQDYYLIVKKLLQKHPELICRKLTQFFINDYKDLFKILNFNNNYLVKTQKICYGLALRKFTNGDIGGGYEFIEHIRFIAFDIDRFKENEYIDLDENEWDEYIYNLLIYNFEFIGLKNPTIIHSGGGRHLLYIINPQLITKSRKLWYKQFIDDINLRFSNELFVVDGLKDFTRVFSLPSTINVKRKKIVKLIKLSFYVNENFKVKSKRKNQYSRKKMNVGCKYPKIWSSLEFKIISHPDVPSGTIHTELLFFLKLLMKQHQLSNDEAEKIEIAVNEVRNSNHLIANYEYGCEKKYYSIGGIINWCERHIDWIVKHEDLYNKFKLYKKIHKENLNKFINKN